MNVPSSVVYAASVDAPSFHPRNGKERVGVHSNRARKAFYCKSHRPDVLAGEHADSAGEHLESVVYRQTIAILSAQVATHRTSVA
jgi:hypothetical protein